ncbi:MAG TPA: diguanylate cyclase [Acidimicrobiales bacterium]|nr:diguanylate cyclase [Acidimicrobiales bacterium]
MDHGAGGVRGGAFHAAETGLVGAEHLHAMLPFLSEAVYVFDRDGDLKARLSPPMGLLGHATGLGTNVFAHLHPDDLPRGFQIGDTAKGTRPGWSGEVRVRFLHADGTWRRCLVRMHNRFGEPGIDGMVAVIRELPAEPGRSEPAGDAELSAIAELPTAYLALGRHGRIRFASEAAAELLGTTREDLTGLPVSELVVHGDQPVVQAAYATLLHTTGARTVVATTRRRFGGRVVEAEFHTRGTDADHKVVTVVLVDHTEEPELVRLATRDPLTGLANRTKVLGTINGLLLEADPVLSVIYVDLDDLKGINDAHGHEAGDQALIAVADHLVRLVRPRDLVGRMSGDEFVIVCPGLTGPALRSYVQQIGEATLSPAPVHAPDGACLAITVSAGGATAAPGDTAASLLRAADEAMFAAKHRRC